MKIRVKDIEVKGVKLPVGQFRSGDWFKCDKCGRTIRMLVRGNIATCSECGGTMRRI